jgi:hypothetical protein
MQDKQQRRKDLEHYPGEAAPKSGTYQLLNVVGSRTGVRADMRQGHPLPRAPRGHRWALEETDAKEC